MLTPQEKARLEKLKRKEQELYIPLTEAELKEYTDRAVDYESSALGHLKGFTDLMNSIGQYTSKIAYDNLRLIDEIGYYRAELEKAKANYNEVEVKETALEEQQEETPRRGRRRKS